MNRPISFGTLILTAMAPWIASRAVCRCSCIFEQSIGCWLFGASRSRDVRQDLLSKKCIPSVCSLLGYLRNRDTLSIFDL